ncbi:MAG: tetratricopeptide repeat protein [Polyangia bacterium]
MSRSKPSSLGSRALPKGRGAFDLSRTTTDSVRPGKAAVLALAVVVIIVYLRTLGAGFVLFDDNHHVYANPFLNPVSLEGIATLWRHAYEWLYIPLAYTILAGIALFAQTPAQVISSLGQAVTVSPAPFHFASVLFHIANTLLCLLLVLRLTRSRKTALLCSFLFALHPLQVESVAWISELRGLTSACFALAALNLLVYSRHIAGGAPAKARVLFWVAALLVICAMLCKPAAVVLPLVALIIDRGALATPWRKSAVTALTWSVCVLPFAFITRSLQHVLPAGMSLWWQRPFVAGDALAFYLSKTVLPINLCIDYGRTPHSVMSHGWGYVIWAIPACLFLLALFYRRRRPMVQLGFLMFVAFLLPNLGLAPFKYQAYSTVADRYAYLPLLGIGLIIGDLASAVRSSAAVAVASAVIIAFAVLSFNQAGHWADNTEFVRHTLDVNPNAGFAQANLGVLLLKQGETTRAIDHFNAALKIDPDDANTENNLGLALVKLGRLDDAELHYRRAIEIDPRYCKAYENLGAVYLQTNRFDAAIASLKTAVELKPSEAKALNDLGIALMQSGRPAQGLEAFRRAVALEPRNDQYRRNLGHALQQQGPPEEAAPHPVP